MTVTEAWVVIFILFPESWVVSFLLLAHALYTLVLSMPPLTWSLPPFPIAKAPLEDVRRENLSESDDSGTEAQVTTPFSKPAEISRVDETGRGSFNAMHFQGERPAWPIAWLSLVIAVRRLACLLYTSPSPRD